MVSISMAKRAREAAAATYRAKIFKNGRSQAIRLPKEVRFEEGQSEVSVRKHGKLLIIEPLDQWPAAFLQTAGSLTDLEIPAVRTPLERARDRFGR
jgi:antitoxin VapB